MTRPIVPREHVARELAVSPQTLVRYESIGLVRLAHQGSVEGYEPSQVRRIWRIVTFQRDLGINLAGVEVILKLCDHMQELHARLGDLAGELRELAEPDEPAGAHSGQTEPHD